MSKEMRQRKHEGLDKNGPGVPVAFIRRYMQSMLEHPRATHVRAHTRHTHKRTHENTIVAIYNSYFVPYMHLVMMY